MELGIHQITDHIQSSAIAAQLCPGIQRIHLFQQVFCHIGLEIGNIAIGSAGAVIVGVIDLIGIFPENQIYGPAVLVEHILLFQKGEYGGLKIPPAAAVLISQIGFPDHIQIGRILGSRLALSQLQFHDLRRFFHGSRHGSLDLGMYLLRRHVTHNAVGQKQRQKPAE